MYKKYNRKPSLCHLWQDEKDWYNEVGGDGSLKAQQKKGANFCLFYAENLQPAPHVLEWEGVYRLLSSRIEMAI